MGSYLLLSPPPPPPLALSFPASSSRYRARRLSAAVVASTDAARSPASAAAAAAASRRRAVLLVGVSVLPLLRLRDTAAAVAAASPSSMDLVTDKSDIPNPEEPQPGEPLSESPQPGVQAPPPVNPLAALLNAIAVIASGVLAGLLGTSRQEKKALQSTISSMEIKLAEKEAAMSLLRENCEERLLEEQAEQKKQARRFHEQQASLLCQLASAKRTVTSISEEFRRERRIAEELKDEIHRLETSVAQAAEEKHVLECKLEEKLETVNILQDKVNLLSQEINEKEKHFKELSLSLSSKEADCQDLHSIYNETKESLELANCKIEQLEKDVFTTRDDLSSKISSINSLNEELQALYTAKIEAEEKINELMREYESFKAASVMRATQDSERLLEKDGHLKELEEKLAVALNDSIKDRTIIAGLNNELYATRTMLENEVEATKSSTDLLQSTEEALRDSRNEVFKLSEELDEANRSKQDLLTQIAKFKDESSEAKQALTNKVAEAETVSKALSDELASVKQMVQNGQEELEAISNQLLSVTEARDNLKKELLDVYKKLESTTHELFEERKITATLHRELEALVKQLQVDSEARRSLEADLDEATKSLDEVNRSTLVLAEELESTNSRIATIETEKEMLSEALAEQKKITSEAQDNMVVAQNVITRFGTGRESFETRSRKLEEELATAKGEILRLRRQISSNGSPKTRVPPETCAPPKTSQPLKEQPVNDSIQKTNKVAAGTPYSAKRTTRRGKGRPGT